MSIRMRRGSAMPNGDGLYRHFFGGRPSPPGSMRSDRELTGVSEQP